MSRERADPGLGGARGVGRLRGGGGRRRCCGWRVVGRVEAGEVVLERVLLAGGPERGDRLLPDDGGDGVARAPGRRWRPAGRGGWGAARAGGRDGGRGRRCGVGAASAGPVRWEDGIDRRAWSRGEGAASASSTRRRSAASSAPSAAARPASSSSRRRSYAESATVGPGSSHHAPSPSARCSGTSKATVNAAPSGVPCSSGVPGTVASRRHDGRRRSAASAALGGMPPGCGQRRSGGRARSPVHRPRTRYVRRPTSWQTGGHPGHPKRAVYGPERSSPRARPGRQACLAIR